MLLLLAACTSPPPDDSDPVKDTADSADSGDSGGDTAPDTTYDALRKAVAKDLKKVYASGASVAIWQNGEVVFAEAFGTRHPDTDEAPDTDTLWQIGSDSKKITAISVLQQVDAGRRSLDDSVAEALPALDLGKAPGWADVTTVHHLISHQGDTYDYTPWDDAPDDAELADRTYGTVADSEYVYAPGGSFWNYSNTNFSLAGLIAEQDAGKAYPDLVEDDVLAPLGMTRSFARLDEVVADGNYATGYGIQFLSDYDQFDPFASGDALYTVGTVEMADQVDNGYTRPAGLIWSTPTDMVKLAAFLIHGDTSVLSDALREQLTTQQVPMYPMAPDLQGYGYGLMVAPAWSGRDGWYETPLWFHGGNTLAMTSGFYVLPELDFAVSVLSNGYGDSFQNTLLAALDLAGLPDAVEVPELLPPAEDVETYAGSYVSDPGVGRLELTWDGTDLQVAAPDLEAAGHTVGATLDPLYKDMFYLRIDGYDYDITFVDGQDGTPKLYAYNRQFGFIATDAEAMRRPHAVRWAITPPTL